MEKFVICFAIFGAAMQAALVSAGRPDWVSDDMMDMVMDDKVRCMAEHGTTEALIDEVNAGTIPSDRALTCYMDCLFSAFGIIDEGELETEMLVGLLPESVQDVAREVMTACANEPGSDPCDKVYNIAKCAQGKRPDMWFML